MFGYIIKWMNEKKIKMTCNLERREYMICLRSPYQRADRGGQIEAADGYKSPYYRADRNISQLSNTNVR